MTAPLSTADLLEGLSSDLRYKYVFFWGDTPRHDGSVDVGLAAQDERAQDPAQWRGLNLLGFALMQARLRLAGEPSR